MSEDRDTADTGNGTEDRPEYRMRGDVADAWRELFEEDYEAEDGATPEEAFEAKLATLEPERWNAASPETRALARELQRSSRYRWNRIREKVAKRRGGASGGRASGRCEAIYERVRELVKETPEATSSALWHRIKREDDLHVFVDEDRMVQDFARDRRSIAKRTFRDYVKAAKESLAGS